MAQPTKSWVAKWQRLEGYVAGVYAVKVVGELPRDILSAMEAEGLSIFRGMGGSLMRIERGE